MIVYAFIQIDLLHRKLGDLHATDVNALRRAYRSLSQHVGGRGAGGRPCAGLSPAQGRGPAGVGQKPSLGVAAAPITAGQQQ